MFGSILPVSGLYVKDARGVRLEGVSFKFLRPDARPVTLPSSALPSSSPPSW